jgi:hypothetical protein
MRIRDGFPWLLGVIALGLAPATPAQEGYPLDGTWRGQWGDESAANHVVIVMKWDGVTINGTINPGPRSIPFTAAALEPADWTVRFEAETADGESIEIEGTLTDIGSYNRSIEGTWAMAGTAYAFKITRE